jgi:hypothetical protein
MVDYTYLKNAFKAYKPHALTLLLGLNGILHGGEMGNYTSPQSNSIVNQEQQETTNQYLSKMGTYVVISLGIIGLSSKLSKKSNLETKLEEERD